MSSYKHYAPTALGVVCGYMEVAAFFGLHHSISVHLTKGSIILRGLKRPRQTRGKMLCVWSDALAGKRLRWLT